MAEFDIQQLVLVSDATNDAENLEHLGPTMKDVYRNNKMKPFLDQLGMFIRRKEMEIEKMCNSNYQEFVQSVDRLLKVRQGTVDLKDKIHTLNTDVQLAGKELTAKVITLSSLNIKVKSAYVVPEILTTRNCSLCSYRNVSW